MGRCHITRKEGSPSATGTIPFASGDHYTDTLTGDIYLSNGNSTSADWVKVGSDSGDIYDCPVGVNVLDVVYVSASNEVDQAIANDITKKLAFGIVTSKPTTVRAQVDTAGRVGGFTGLIVGAPVFLSDATLGGLTQNPPVGSDTWVQMIGVATSETEISVEVGQPMRRS